jgi:hypothetical protein
MHRAGAEGFNRVDRHLAQAKQAVDAGGARFLADFAMQFGGIRPSSPMSPSTRMRVPGRAASTWMAASTESGLAL